MVISASPIRAMTPVEPDVGGFAGLVDGQFVGVEVVGEHRQDAGLLLEAAAGLVEGDLGRVGVVLGEVVLPGAGGPGGGVDVDVPGTPAQGGGVGGLGGGAGQVEAALAASGGEGDRAEAAGGVEQVVAEEPGQPADEAAVADAVAAGRGAVGVQEVVDLLRGGEPVGVFAGGEADGDDLVGERGGRGHDGVLPSRQGGHGWGAVVPPDRGVWTGRAALRWRGAWITSRPRVGCG